MLAPSSKLVLLSDLSGSSHQIEALSRNRWPLCILGLTFCKPPASQKAKAGKRVEFRRRLGAPLRCCYSLIMVHLM